MQSLSIAILALFLASCVAITRTPGITVASSPPGARVLVDGRDSGFVTPCDLGLDRSGHRIDLMLDGYETATRRVGTTTRRDLIFWREAYINENTWHFPLWLHLEDGLAPFKWNRDYSPRRLFVRLRLSGAQ